jgi:hypothetical protein
MTDTDRMSALHEEQERGRRASELLSNELLQDALKAIEAEVIEQWKACPARDAEGKEALWQLMKTADKFRGLLTGHIEAGKLAAANLKRYEEKRGLRDILRRA